MTSTPNIHAVVFDAFGTLVEIGDYQQTYVDTYCKIAHAKLYTTKTPITAADMLNDKVLPYMEEHEFPVHLIRHTASNRRKEIATLSDVLQQL